MHRNHIRTDIEQDVCPGNRNKCTAVLDRILKMSLVPSLFVVAGLLILPYTDFSDWGKLGLGIIAFSVFYLPVSYRLSLNNYERNYFNSFMRKIKFVR